MKSLSLFPGILFFLLGPASAFVAPSGRTISNRFQNAAVIVPSTTVLSLSTKRNDENSPFVDEGDSFTTLQSVQTVAYRASLLGATAALGFQCALPILQEAGLSIQNVVDGTTITTALVACTAAACALAPKAKRKKPKVAVVAATKKKQVAFLQVAVDGKVLAASVATAIAGQPFIGLAALFVREIYYFGVSYKVEAVIGLAASLGALLAIPDAAAAPFSEATTSLALAVMVFGKVFEPLEEDWQANQSEFLAQQEMK